MPPSPQSLPQSYQSRALSTPQHFNWRIYFLSTDDIYVANGHYTDCFSSTKNTQIRLWIRLTSSWTWFQTFLYALAASSLAPGLSLYSFKASFSGSFRVVSILPDDGLVECGHIVRLKYTKAVEYCCTIFLCYLGMDDQYRDPMNIDKDCRTGV